MITLGIETSCDETSCAVLKGRNEVLSNVVSSSLERHQAYGGVVPEIASRHCLEAIDVVYRSAVKKAGIRGKEIDLIAVTRGPGLIGSLLVGVSFAKALSFGWKIPMVGVNHLEAHLDANFIEERKPAKPFIGLVVSGGHTALVYHEKGRPRFAQAASRGLSGSGLAGGRYRLLGETVDDAVGEAYDKVAKILGLGYPGGPAIDRLAALGNPKAMAFTKPKIDRKLDFSFSGIKTAVLYYVQKSGPLPEQAVKDLCASFQSACVEWLVEKTMAACAHMECKIIVTGGGVTANSYLRKRLAEEAGKRKIKIYIPPFKYTTDNAAMIARNGMEKFCGAGMGLDMTADPNLGIG